MKVVASFLLAVQVAVIMGCWAWYHIHHPLGNLLTGSTVGQWLAYGRLTGLLVAFGALVQLLLVGRLPWVERAFGQDRLTRLHHVFGFSLVVLLLAHPVLVLAGHAAQAGLSLKDQYLDFMKSWEDLPAASAGLLLMVAALAFSLVVLLKKIRYEAWYATHLLFYLAIALSFGHQLEVGTDLTVGVGWFRYYWIVLFAFVFLNLLVYRVIRPIASYARHRFTVAEVRPETQDVTSVILTGRDLASFRIRAGEFMSVRFLAPGLRWEAHPFSLSCRPDGTRLRLSIKQLGDFTRRIPSLKPGTRVIVNGPYGVFTAARSAAPKLLLIAGGIGITPLRGLAEEFIAAGRDVLLVYGNRNARSIAFERELADLVTASAGRFRVVHVISDDPAWTGERGRVDRERLSRLVPDLSGRDVYLCGPPVMMRGVRAALASLGVPRRRIFFERFAL